MTFEEAVARLRVPGMGTEVVAPLLQLLIQLVRPRRVLEVGMGYTTPFIASALAALESQVRAEHSGLVAKQDRPIDDAWLYEPPALLAPSFYASPYRPEFVAVDDLSLPTSSAPLVRSVLDSLDLDVTVINAPLQSCRALLPAGFAPIDLAWVDAWECLYFFENFWDLINPAGGLVVMHYLMTYPEGEAIVDYIADVLHAHPGELEMVNLVEPHKLTQNSLTVLRRTESRPAPLSSRGGQVDYATVFKAL
ncbi:hypothetical protein Lesp02_00140 [Lentzea sp. NBRC 105346]|uniref:hypothetical protein n=1 Tax=Lentzea sp. NBRC 105346 TaxID=3032205 RepID=UPI0024A032BF|nr:hypothetical protein [Lentzea sp. NBRC 105346]GLZ27824.1 hypothetical protein Lesp02_00140 [Lentzea sp. NBRC 105346]